MAFSITGPYGSGKSSMAVVIDALLGPAGDPAQIAAMDFLADVRLPVAERLEYAQSVARGGNDWVHSRHRHG